MDIPEMIQFFQSIIYDVSDADTLSHLVRLLVWGDFVTRTGCITPDDFDVNMTKMDGNTFQLQFQRQLLLRSPRFFMKFEHALEKLEAEDVAHAKLSRKMTDDATHFSDGYESLGQLNNSKQWTKKIDNIVINEHFDRSSSQLRQVNVLVSVLWVQAIPFSRKRSDSRNSKHNPHCIERGVQVIQLKYCD
jgi:hypothetical protein